MEQFIGKNVKLILFDGYVKRGILRSTDNLFYYLEFSDGSVVGINKTTVKQISEGGHSR